MSFHGTTTRASPRPSPSPRLSLLTPHQFKTAVSIACHFYSFQMSHMRAEDSDYIGSVLSAHSGYMTAWTELPAVDGGPPPPTPPKSPPRPLPTPPPDSSKRAGWTSTVVYV